MKSYLFLFIAVVCEVIGTLLLPLSQNFSKLIPTISLLSFYVASVYFLTLTIEKLPLSIVYASWSGLGIFLIALFSYIFYKQVITWPVAVGLVFIIVGVILVNIFKVK